MQALRALSVLLFIPSHALAQSSSTTSKSSDPTTPSYSDAQTWITAFITIHSLSKNSYVYMYILWIAIGIVFFALCTATWSRVRMGALGARWQKWALRRRTWRKKHALKAAAAEAKRRGVPVSAVHKQPTALPSNAQILSASVLTTAVLLVCFVGPDYIDPNIDLFHFWDPSSGSSSSSFATKAKRAGTTTVNDQTLSAYIAHYTITKSVWTLAARTGGVAFALLPLVVVLALKAAPFALFAIPGLVGYGHDKMIRLHRYVGRLTWFVTFLHVIFWVVQACRERRTGTGEMLITIIWQFQKFQFAWVAFISMTILMICSLDIIRNPHYNVFYTSHIIFTPLTIVFSALHHPQRSVWYWCLAALVLWLGERFWRLCSWIYVNGVFSSREKGNGVGGAAAVSPYTFERPESGFLQAHGKTPSKGSVATLIDPRASQYNPKAIDDHESATMYAPTPRRPLQEPPSVRLVGEGYERESVYSTPSRIGSPASTIGDTDDYNSAPRPSEMLELARQESGHGMKDVSRGVQLQIETSAGSRTPTLPPAALPHDWHSASQNGIHSYPPRSATAFSGNGPRSAVSAFQRASFHQVATYAPPPGYAHATLLPGRTVRLRLVTPGYQIWAPGQHFLVLIPSVSRFETHPFTVASVCDEQAAPRSAGALGREEEGAQIRTAEAGREIVLIIRAKKGWTKSLWDLVSTLQSEGLTSYPGEHSGTASSPPEGTPGVILRTMVDGPFGSASNTRWGSYASVLIVSGGSGVSFGLSVLEYLCLCIAGRDGRFLGGHPGGWGVGPKGAWVTQRVRFVWLIREYAHIQWCVSALRRCLTIVPTDALELNIFVSNFKPPKELLASPTSIGDFMRSDDGHSDTHEDGLLKPPAPRFANAGKSSKRMSSSEDSIASDISVDSIVDSYFEGYGYADSQHGGDGEEGLGHETTALDYTNFDGDDDTPLPGENRLSRKIIKESKLRRMQSRKVKKAVEAKRVLEDRVAASQAQTQAQAHTRVLSLSDESFNKAGKRFSTQTTQSNEPLLPYGQGASSSSALTPISPSTSGYGGFFDQHPPRLQSQTPPPSFGVAATELASSSSSPPRHSHTPSKSRRLSISTTSTFALHSPRSPHSPTPSASASAPVLRWLEPEPELELNDRKRNGERERSRGVELTLNAQEVSDLQVVSEWAQPGKPKLGRILGDEVENAKGRVAVVCCGPTSLNALMRKHIAEKIDPGRVARGDLRGSIDFIAEDFEY